MKARLVSDETRAFGNPLTMRLSFVALLTASTAVAPAFAQPAARCAVTVVRAPDDVRLTIEPMLATEHCTTSLQVRVIPTERGLYVIAGDEHGRMRERVVPNATSAAVLIASWASDDSITGAPPIPVPPVSAPPVAAVHDGIMGPSMVPSTAPSMVDEPDRSDEDDEVAPVQHPARFITLGIGGAAGSGTGIRAEVDLLDHCNWTFGILGSITGETMRVTDYMQAYATNYTATTSDYALAVAVGGTHRWGTWHLRTGAALGLVISTLELEPDYSNQNSPFAGGSGTTASPWLEAHLLAGHSLGATKRWELEVGATVSYAKQSWFVGATMETLARDAGSIMLVANVRRGI